MTFYPTENMIYALLLCTESSTKMQYDLKGHPKNQPVANLVFNLRSGNPLGIL